MLTPIDGVLATQPPRANLIVPELLIALGFGFNCAVLAALVWFRASRPSDPSTAGTLRP
jgi:hypothetical protein